MPKFGQKILSKAGATIDGRFKISKKIGEGAFGDIYFAYDTVCGENCAIKFESEKCNFLQLPIEYRALQAVNGEIGFPKCIAYGRDSGDLYLAMTLLDRNLKELFEQCGKNFSLKTVLYIAIHCISRIEALHRKNLVYRDIKPENFMVGLPGTSEEKLIHLIDFGMVKEFIDPRTGLHIRFRTGKPVTGTARYMSCNAHFNYELSRRDDLESLGYMLLFLLKGSLPWSGLIQHGVPGGNPIEQYQKIGSMKQALPPEDLFEGFPQEFATYLSYVRNLGFDETPDYVRLCHNFASVFEKYNLIDDGIFDWNSQSSSSSSPPTSTPPPS